MHQTFQVPSTVVQHLDLLMSYREKRPRDDDYGRDDRYGGGGDRYRGGDDYDRYGDHGSSRGGDRHYGDRGDRGERGDRGDRGGRGGRGFRGGRGRGRGRVSTWKDYCHDFSFGPSDRTGFVPIDPRFSVISLDP